MAEPTSTFAASVVYGAGALVTAAFGVEMQALIAATVGSTLGVSLAPPTSRWGAVLRFFAVVVVCATVGTYVSNHFMGGDRVGRNFVATMTGIFFHPAFTSILEQLPKWLEALRGLLPTRKGPP